MKIDWMHERLVRWASWSMRGGLALGLWYTRCTLGTDTSSGCAPDAKLDQEALTTQSAVSRLVPLELRVAVHAYYCGQGTLKQRAKDAGCSEATLHRRIDHAHERLVVLMGENRPFGIVCTFAKEGLTE